MKKKTNIFRVKLDENRQTVEQKYWSNDPIDQLLREYSQGVDDILSEIWSLHLPSNSLSTLYAVGGYGREELHPYSDIDLLLVSETLEKEKSNNTLKGDLIKNTFITSSMGVSYKVKLGKSI